MRLLRLLRQVPLLVSRGRWICKCSGTSPTRRSQNSWATSSLSSSKLITCRRCVPVKTARPSYPDICADEHSQVFHDLSRHGKAPSAVAVRRRQRMTTSEMTPFGTSLLCRTTNSRSAKPMARLERLAASSIGCEQKIHRDQNYKDDTRKTVCVM